MKDKKIKIAFAGSGNIAGGHMAAYGTFQQDVEVVACADPNKTNLKNFGERYGIGAKHRYSSLKELLNKEKDIDAVDVCTPPDFHVPSIIEAVNAKKHVVCEKPFSTNYNDAKKAVEEAEKAGVRLMIVQNYRWRSEYVMAKETLKT